MQKAKRKMQSKAYTQHKGKVTETGGKFKHVMAIALDPTSQYKKGIVRCIVSREGDVEVSGYIDRSELYLLEGDTLDSFKITKRLNIKNEVEIIGKITPKGWDFIGLEDPDIFVDDKTSLMHIYFTIPIKPSSSEEKIKIHLGHAVGKDLNSLEMTMPVLMDEGKHDESAKEVSIAPLNSKGTRFNLIESRDRKPDTTYSIVKIAIAEDMARPWKYGETVFHPAEHK